VMALHVVWEWEWQAAGDARVKKMGLAQLACFVFFGYARALRGEEISKIEVTGVIKYFADGATTNPPPHMTLSLIRRFKQESWDQHFLPVAAVIRSGLRLRKWTERLLDEKRAAGLITGFMFLNYGGNVAKAAAFEEQLITRLEWIQQNTEGIIPASINLWEEFGVRRSMRRGATTEAPNAGIDGATIDANNGWRNVEAAKGKMPRYSMRQRYKQVVHDLIHQLKFSLGIWGSGRGGFRTQYVYVWAFIWLLCPETLGQEK
jgi:hypothetical protein